MSYKWLRADPPPQRKIQSLNEIIKSVMLLSCHLETYQYKKDGGSSNGNKIMVKEDISQKL